jgi:hypothetical protein
MIICIPLFKDRSLGAIFFLEFVVYLGSLAVSIFVLHYCMYVDYSEYLKASDLQ